jgi:hypothetical protein
VFDKNTDAKESFRGYNLQVLRAIRRLLQGISENKLIYSAIECGDDVYEIKITDSDYKHTYEQDKLYSNNGFSLNSIEVKKSICIFLNKWINVKDESIRFVFYTNVEITKEKKVGILQPPKKKCIELLIDVMNPSSWLEVKAYFINVIKDYYINIYNSSNSNITQIQSLTEEEWHTFATCIEWMFRSDDDIKLRNLLRGEIVVLCKQYKVELDFVDFLLAAIESDIRQGVVEKDFINQLVSTDRLINYFLNLSQYRLKESFELNDAWFAKRLQSSIERLSDRYSQKLDIEREETVFLDYMSGEFCEQDIMNSKEYKEYKKLLDYPFLMIKGEAGVGKSHFIAHSAVKYLNNYGKAVLILGQYCRSEEILKRKIINYLEIGSKCEFHDFLKHMDDWGRVTGRRSIIFFDAVNEGKNIEEEIEELALTIKQYENVGFVYSVRGNRKAMENVNNFLCINLDRLKKKKDIEAFFIFYNIPLSYNYQDMDIFKLPLLLKMYCKLFEGKEFNAEDGLYTIFPLYFKSVTKRILKKYPHDKTKADIVGTALEIYADLVIKNVDEYVNYSMLSADIDKKLGCYKLSFNVVDELLNENILVYNEKDDTVFVEFNLWSDYLIVKQILHNEEVKEFDNEEQLKKFFSPQNSYYNLLVMRDEMLAILLPDISCKYKNGGFELYYWASYLKHSENVYLFLNSMYWRDLRKICAVGFSIYINDNRVAINNSYDARFDVWDCIMQQCSRSTRYFSVNYIYEMSQIWINEVMQRNWASYLNDKFFESDYFKRLNYSIDNQLDLFDKDQIFNQLRVFTLFLYSLDSRIISRSMKTIAILMKKDPKVIIKFLKSLNGKCKDETVYTKLVQIIFNIADYIDALTITEIYRFLFENLKGSFYIGKYKFLDLWYINGIRDIMVTRNLKIEDDVNFDITSFINHFVFQGLEEISNSDLEKYYREKNERETEFDEYIEYNDDESGELYYQCQNKIVNAFLNNFKEDSYRFSSDFLVSEIAEPYKQMFLNNVLSEILKSEYSYIRYGFHDYWSNKPHYQKKYAEKYEEIALDRVICKYLRTLLTNGIKLSIWVQKVVTHINEFTFVDCSIPENVSSPIMVNTEINTEIIKLQDKLENNDKWIPISFGCNLNYDLYIYIKGQTIDRYIREKTLLEGIFYNELYRTKHFYKTVELTNTNEQVLIKYLWDYDPFTSITLLHPKIINKLDLQVGECRCTYYYKDELVCKNTVFENRTDQLVIKRSFLIELQKKYEIAWCFKNGKEIILN